MAVPKIVHGRRGVPNVDTLPTQALTRETLMTLYKHALS